MRRLRKLIACILMPVGFLPAAAFAQIPMEVYENPENLQVLSPDISPEDLREAMFSIGQQVGLRCSKCHAFEADTPFAERDYASDERELKRVAREMMRMVRDVNKTVASIERGPDHEPLTVRCMTCHRGVSQPRQIDEIFLTAMGDEGISAAVDEYRELRVNWYATGAYDFSAWRLGGIAQDIFDDGDADSAMQVHALNLELNGEDGSVYFHRAESYEKQGRTADAVADFERALELEPDSFGFLTDRIEQLKSQLE